MNHIPKMFWSFWLFIMLKNQVLCSLSLAINTHLEASFGIRCIQVVKAVTQYGGNNEID